MNYTDISKTTPVEPYIEVDGWYAQCCRCWTEIQPTTNICPKCGQKQNWLWLEQYKIN